MPSILTLSGSSESKKSEGEKCKCVDNPRTKRRTKICFVGKSSKNRSGWQITGTCPKPKR